MAFFSLQCHYLPGISLSHDIGLLLRNVAVSTI